LEQKIRVLDENDEEIRRKERFKSFLPKL